MRSLFDGITTTGQESWHPSRQGLPKNGADKHSSSAQPTVENSYIHIYIEPESPESPSSSKEMSLPKRKYQKKNNEGDLDENLLVVLNTLEQSDGPSIEECNKKLDEIATLPMDDPLYIAASSIFCESKAYREQWVMFSQKPEVVRIACIRMNAKKLGLLQFSFR